MTIKARKPISHIIMYTKFVYKDDTVILFTIHKHFTQQKCANTLGKGHSKLYFCFWSSASSVLSQIVPVY